MRSVQAFSSIAPQHHVVVVKRKTLQVVTRPEGKTAADVVGIIELIVADAHTHGEIAKLIAAVGDDTAQGRADIERIRFVEQVFHEVGCLEIGDNQLARAFHLVVHGLENRISRGCLRAIRRSQMP